MSNIDLVPRVEVSFQSLLEADSNLNHHAGEKPEFIAGICLPVQLEEQHLLFIKDNKVLKSLGQTLLAPSTQPSYTQIPKNCGVILAEQLTQDWNAFLSGSASEIDNSVRESLGKWWVMTSTNVDLSMCRVSKVFYQSIQEREQILVDGRKMGSAEIHPTCEISERAFIGENVRLGAGVKVHPGAVIYSNVVIGEGTEIFANVVVYSRCAIGKNCRIHANSTVGADGFGYNFIDGVHRKIYHWGGVQIGNDVEIGANSSVDGGTFRPTRIGDGSKIDNDVQIAHNVQMGKHVIMCGSSGVAGSASIGDYCVFGGRAALAPHCHLASGIQLAGAAMVNHDWTEPGVKLGGHPARPVNEWLQGQAFIKRSLQARKTSVQKDR